ncbi:MAG TPA: imidazole glycerol phosphate synthase subunit HisH [Bryobacteraceae bacterium]|nr:imidazole glycerol phosphate synthase subunit HisH [Bryobacteraceae bacterium]
MLPRVTVADYGIGNLRSVLRALEACGADAALSSDPEEVAVAERLILPGVGAFAQGMDELRRRDLIEPIQSFARTGRPFLGICLGMQMMLATGHEFGTHAGLGLMAGTVEALPVCGAGGRPHKIPHIGWNRIFASGGWARTILAGLEDAVVYFVHSYVAVPELAAVRFAECDYDGSRFVAAVRSENLYGCQFHPEKSGPTGLRILANFLALA